MVNRLVAGLLALVVWGGLVACGGSDEPDKADLPTGIGLHIDQSRIERKTREVFVRIENDSTKELRVFAFVLTSGRFGTVRWKGDETVGRGEDADLKFTMPLGRCGSEVGASVRLIYRHGTSADRESASGADDPYDAIRLLLDRDCARRTLAEAASLSVGQPTVTGTRTRSVLHLPLTLTPTGERTDVGFGGFESTPLFRQAPESPTAVDMPVGRGDAQQTIVMSIVPAGCDPHALAEDKVGTLFGMRVVAAGLPEDTSFYLPLDKSQRTAMFDYLRQRCGLE